MDLAALRRWGAAERERAAQRTKLNGASSTAPELAPEPRGAWRSRAAYARRARTWADAGVTGTTGRDAMGEPLSDVEREESVDVQLIVTAAGRVRASILPLSTLANGLPGTAAEHLPIDTGADADAEDDAAGRVAAGSTYIELTMVSQQQLFAHQLYPSAVASARLLDSSLVPCARGAVLELGAGPALPCIVAALNGARAVVATDFPDDEMLRNTEANLRANLPPQAAARCRTVGHAWGRDCEPVLAALRELGGNGGFDLVILSDLLYELEHAALLRTCTACLSARPSSRLLVVFQPHDPVNLQRQLAFFALAAQPPFELESRRLLCLKAPPMFELAATAGSTARRVHLHLLRRAAHCRQPWGLPFDGDSEVSEPDDVR